MKYTIKKLTTSILEKAPKEIGLSVAILATVVASGTIALAYGPERQTFTMANPSDHVAFNSITDNPNHGDERNFVQVKDASDTGAGNWKDSLAVQDGKEYLVRILVHNNAASNLNLVATNTRVMASVPATTGNSVQIDGFVSADNASPQKVWDDAVMTSDKKFNIAYVAGSSEYTNNIFTGGTPLPDSIVTSTGALVGYDKMDGNVSGCFKYSGAAFFKVKASVQGTPNFSVEKKVKIHGTDTWSKAVNAQPGQQVDYQIGYKNTGTSPQDNVVAKDKLPNGVSYVNNTTTVKNTANTNGDGLKLTSNDLTNTATNGVNIGNYNPGSNAFVRFTATLPTADKLTECNTTLTNTATIYTTNGNLSDTANVTITKANCTPVPAELPTTGPVEFIASVIGLAAITTGGFYYYKSRRELQDVLQHTHENPVAHKK